VLMFWRQLNLPHLICVVERIQSTSVSRFRDLIRYPKPRVLPARRVVRLARSHAPTISCIVCWMNSLKESSCWRTKPFSSKKELMTTHASSCALRKRVRFGQSLIFFRDLRPRAPPPRAFRHRARPRMRRRVHATVRARSNPRERRERRRIRDECGVDRGRRSVISAPSRRLRALARRARAFKRTCPISSSSSSSLESTRMASSSS